MKLVTGVPSVINLQLWPLIGLICFSLWQWCLSAKNRYLALQNSHELRALCRLTRNGCRILDCNKEWVDFFTKEVASHPGYEEYRHCDRMFWIGNDYHAVLCRKRPDWIEAHRLAASGRTDIRKENDIYWCETDLVYSMNWYLVPVFSVVGVVRNAIAGLMGLETRYLAFYVVVENVTLEAEIAQLNQLAQGIIS